MSKRIKDLMIHEYKSSYNGVDSACLVSLVGLDGVSTNQLRGKLREKNIHLRVIRNCLAKQAFQGSPLAPLARGMQGACAIVHGGESVIDVAKTLTDAANEFTAIELLTGIIEGDEELIPVEKLAKMKGKQELIGEVAMLLTSPGSAVAGALAGVGGRIAACLKAIAEKEQ